MFPSTFFLICDSANSLARGDRSLHLTPLSPLICIFALKCVCHLQYFIKIPRAKQLQVELGADPCALHYSRRKDCLLWALTISRFYVYTEGVEGVQGRFLPSSVPCQLWAAFNGGPQGIDCSQAFTYVKKRLLW